MDAEHRRELKTNELADWVAHFPEWCRQNTTTLIGVVLILAAAVVFVYGRRIRSAGQLERMAHATTLIERYDMSKFQAVGSLQQGMGSGDAIMIAANQLEMGVEDVKSPHVSAMLLIKYAEALRADLHYRSGDVDVEIREDRIKTARESYEKALKLAEGNSTLVAMARYGLGLCAEEVNDTIRAEEIYSGIIADEDFAATVFPTQARHRLANLKDNQKQYTFEAAPPAPVTPPASEVGAAPITPAAPGTTTAGPAGEAGEVTIGAPETESPAAEVKEDEAKEGEVKEEAATDEAPAGEVKSEAETAESAAGANEGSAGGEASAGAPGDNS
ncbi:MAG TPA: hypothetical protein P5279_00300 [Anaerohalosphaeraceae bacterium]|jgi:predicted negative regulator of RcsB-dependent stress response/HAMP domain-containing protein|nr:hypothetical protein [Anaerohalosphaeraceae bacterium]HRT48905.1 hypothetical protein [Anaerohalosphaeraceae bacterium]HRT85028.1 hypothetical protein [Anaerohalosphaeraceae bacterium]